ncbi:hypothetical protein L3X38_043213 [Prunus dulcis]|uniref:Uncharacterized protein n=1 Tax=Prunus dulcis TaxID=3755 RepID=A0AAD4UY11_PRUDU|nr:hypothetical protein L3X38_043213 [Prunus dulcis]
MVAKREAKASTVPPLSSPLTCPTLSSTLSFSNEGFVFLLNLSWRRHSTTSDQLGGSKYKGNSSKFRPGYQTGHDRP